jgi:hypothetical protein
MQFYTSRKDFHDIQCQISPKQERRRRTPQTHEAVGFHTLQSTPKGRFRHQEGDWYAKEIEGKKVELCE